MGSSAATAQLGCRGLSATSKDRWGSWSELGLTIYWELHNTAPITHLSSKVSTSRPPDKWISVSCGCQLGYEYQKYLGRRDTHGSKMQRRINGARRFPWFPCAGLLSVSSFIKALLVAGLLGPARSFPVLARRLRG